MKARIPMKLVGTLAVLLAAPLARPVDAGAQSSPPSAPVPASVRAEAMEAMEATFRRAQRLVNDGAGAEGRALVDSVLEMTEPRSAAEAEALFWRATLAESWEHAQRDYLRLMLEHERSPRAGDAMLRLAQGEVARGDREAAERYLERLAREAPASPARAEGGLWHGRLLLERGMRDQGCGILRGTRMLVRAGALELENQFDYLLNQCPAELASADSAAPGANPPVAAAPPAAALPASTEPPTSTEPTVPPRAGSRVPAPAGWSVQVAAFSTMAEGKALVARLAERGYEARVDGEAAPFRVRFGRYTTRAAAAAAMTSYREKERADAFLVQVPRG